MTKESQAAAEAIGPTLPHRPTASRSQPMTWEPEIAEIAKRKELAKARGGPEGIARQRKIGRAHV